MTRASISLPVPVSPVSRTGQGTRGDPPGDRDELGRLLGDPEALGIALEGLGRPQRGALLLVAAVAVERTGGGDELADGGERAAMVELRPRPRQHLPGLVAMLAEDDEVVGGRRPHRRQRLGVGPAVALDQPHPAPAARRQRQRLGTAACPAGSQTPRARECAGGPRARGAPRRSRGGGSWWVVAGRPPVKGSLPSDDPLTLPVCLPPAQEPLSPCQVVYRRAPVVQLPGAPSLLPCTATQPRKGVNLTVLQKMWRSVSFPRACPEPGRLQRAGGEKS